MTAKPIYGRVRTGLLFINLHNDFLSEGGKLWPRVATNSEPDEGQPHKEANMYSKNSPQRRPTSAKLRRLFAISVSSLALLPMGAASAQTGTSPVVYEFGRPARADEHTYDWYRRTHAEAASARYGIPADVIGDGMDTWHWWVGVDNPGFWRESTKATSKSPGNLLGVKVDFLRLLLTVPRNKRFELIGLINDPDTVAADKPDRYGLMLDRMKEGTLTWDADTFGYSTGIIGLQLFANKQAVRPAEVVTSKVSRGSGQC